MYTPVKHGWKYNMHDEPCTVMCWKPVRKCEKNSFLTHIISVLRQWKLNHETWLMLTHQVLNKMDDHILYQHSVCTINVPVDVLAPKGARRSLDLKITTQIYNWCFLDNAIFEQCFGDPVSFKMAMYHSTWEVKSTWWHFQMYFCLRQLLYFNSNFFEICSNDHINNKRALFQIIAWRRTGDKPLSEIMIIWFTYANTRHSASISWQISLLTNCLCLEVWWNLFLWAKCRWFVLTWWRYYLSTSPNITWDWNHGRLIARFSRSRELDSQKVNITKRLDRRLICVTSVPLFMFQSYW